MGMLKSLIFNRSVLGLLIGACIIVSGMNLYIDSARKKIVNATALIVVQENAVIISQLTEFYKKLTPQQAKSDPVALINSFNEKLKQKGSTVNLRLITETSKKDAFQKQAFRALSINPNQPLYIIDNNNNNAPMLRYAILNTIFGDTSVANHSVLEIDFLMKKVEIVGETESIKILWAMVITAILTIFILVFFLGRLRYTADMLFTSNQTLENTNKKLDQERLKEIKRSDDLSSAKAEAENVNQQLQAAFKELRILVQEIQTSAGVINSAAGEIAVGNNDLSKRTDEQAAVLEETSASITELTTTVKQNVENAKQVSQMAELSYNTALKGGKAVSQVVNTMSTIQESSHKIVDIITVIDNIAFQTKMLALNAAVEAARAGEQGRGFGVVASEIRNLAQHTATAAKEIKTLISDSVEQIRTGAVLVNDAGHTMEEIMSSAKQVSDIIANIVSASIEQSNGIEQVNEAISRIDSTTQQNAALVRQSAAVAESLESHTRHMESLVNLFDANKVLEKDTYHYQTELVAPNSEGFSEPPLNEPPAAGDASETKVPE